VSVWKKKKYTYIYENKFKDQEMPCIKNVRDKVNKLEIYFLEKKIALNMTAAFFLTWLNFGYKDFSYVVLLQFYT